MSKKTRMAVVKMELGWLRPPRQLRCGLSPLQVFAYGFFFFWISWHIFKSKICPYFFPLLHRNLLERESSQLNLILLFKNVKKCIRAWVKYPSCFLMGQLSFQDDVCFISMVWRLTFSCTISLEDSFAFAIVREHACSSVNANRFLNIIYKQRLFRKTGFVCLFC